MNNCAWLGIFKDDENIVLQEVLTATGLISIILGLWLNLTLVASNLRRNSSYNNLTNFTLATLMRRIVSVIPQLPLIKHLASTYGFEGEFCECFAFMETFLAVFEVECLTHVCIERYVVAKFVTNGWTISRAHYYLFLSLCFLFAFTYSLPPLFGFGHYGYDFTCTTCTFDMILPDSWDKYFIISVFMLRSVKPSLVMITMLIWARMLERQYVSSDKSRDLVRFTRNVAKITAVNLICWTPIAAIRGWVILSQILFAEPILAVPVFYIQWAMWIHWGAPAATVLALLIVDRRVRSEMFFCSKNGSYSSRPNKAD
ncbi:hypothetical protein K1T71_002744 [Dendrolimus kikuchii]|uniref:Uncharacterized protein n=1 Tax=Dendrolimus kikuchii TaxID=765133 RepID=A0ACC1DEJ9_9NEOP|nr:hypothetical protein K1T71_002744 [Dendrolimus kikuchii]